MAKNIIKRPSSGRKRSRDKGGTVEATAKQIPKTRLLEIALASVALIVGVVGIVLWVLSIEHRELVYAVNPIRTTIVSAEACSPDFQVSYRGVDLGCADITVAHVAIWNDGNLSIRPENVRRDVVVFTDPAAAILDASVRGLNGKETGFATTYDEESWERGRVKVSWQMLEKNEGDSVQITYLGAPTVDIYVDGKIEGFGTVKRIDLGLAPKQGKSWTEVFESQKQSQIVWWVLFGLAILATLTVIIEWRRGFRDISRFTVISMCVVTWLYAIMFFFVTPKFVSWPPFGF